MQLTPQHVDLLVVADNDNVGRLYKSAWGRMVGGVVTTVRVGKSLDGMPRLWSAPTVCSALANRCS